MPINPGDLVDGIVGKIVPYGAFINLPEGKRGLVHISEIANSFVTDVNQYLKERQVIKVRVLQISPDGRKVDLSIKQVEKLDTHPKPIRKPGGSGGGRSHEPPPTLPSGAPGDIQDLYAQIKASMTKGEGGAKDGAAPRSEFEDKLSKFLKSSEEKLSDVRKNLEAKRGGKKGRF